MSGKRLRLAPANLPEIRDRLCELVKRTKPEPPADLEPFMRVLLRKSWRVDETLAAAPCWWVSSDMEELAIAASEGVPQDVVPETSTGFLVFQRPIAIRTSSQDSLNVQGVGWSYGAGPGISSLSLELFSPVGDFLPYASESARRHILKLGLPIVPLPESISQIAGHVHEMVCNVLLAVWALSSQKRLCETKPVSAPWPASKGGPKPDPMARTVKMLVLREPPRSHGSGSGDGGAGRYSHRFVVHGFWRNQPCGPGHSERRLTWVAPFVKGPEGTPLVERETVRVWKR